MLGRDHLAQHLDVAMLDASMVLLAVGSVRQLMTGDSISATQPIVHDRPTVAPYRTTDGIGLIVIPAGALVRSHVIGAPFGSVAAAG